MKSSADAILNAAIKAFDEYGYDGTSVRTISSAAQVSVSALYYHYGTKEQLFVEIMLRAISEIQAGIGSALDAAGDNPVARFAAATRAFVLYYTEPDYQAARRLADSQLRRLNKVNFERLVEERRKLSATFEALITDGANAGVFQVAQVGVVARAVIVLCRDVANWFHAPRAELSADEVADMYVGLALRMCGWIGANP